MAVRTCLENQRNVDRMVAVAMTPILTLSGEKKVCKPKNRWMPKALVPHPHGPTPLRV